MSKAKKPAAVVGLSADAVEAAFYEALYSADLEKLMACWADAEDVVCIHPGGPRLVGRGSIRAAFEAVFSNGSLRVLPESVRKVEALHSSVHNVRECIEVLTDEGLHHAYVIATNVYHKTPQGWRMVLHHASPGADQEVQEISEVPIVFH